MSKKTGYLCLLFTIVLFSTFEVVSRSMVTQVNPFQLSFLRFFIGGVLLFIYMAFTESIRIERKELLWAVLTGVINVCFSMVLMQLSLTVVGAKASVSAVLMSVNPIIVTALACIIDKEKLAASQVIGLLIGLFGVVVVSLGNLDLGEVGFLSPLLAFLSAVAFAFYTVIGRRVSMRIGSIKMNAYGFLIASLLLVPPLLIFRIPVFYVQSEILLRVLYLGIMVSGVAYISYFKGLAVVGASKGSMSFFIKPLLASAIAIIFLNEKLTANLVIGTVLVLSGIAIVIYWDKIHALKPAEKPAEKVETE